MSTAIVWFRRDLRLADNPALDAALAAHARVVPVYVHAPAEEAPWQPGAASRWWLHRSLAALGADLAARGARLHVAQGESLAVLRDLVRASGADAVYWNRLYEPAVVARDTRVKQALREDGVAVHSFNAAMFAEPWEIETGQGGPYRVFTPYWRKLRATLEPRPPLPAPARVDAPPLAGSLALDALRLLPRIAWDAGLRENWTPGEAGARAALDDFLGDALVDYAHDRDRPDRPGTSRLSPHLHFGEISPRQVHWRLEEHARDAPARTQALRAAAEPYLRELGWRDFSLHLLFHFPQTPESNLNPAFDAFPWAARNEAAIDAWQRGRTGVPIVDAGMRELWHTGWMHNRVRMIVASFLTKNLRQHWRHGAQWFWDTLVDADLANNTQGWQWTAGTGADAAPYFRIFNPVTQGERYDPDGRFVRRWVPELAVFPAKTVHAPWKDAAALARSGYVEPIVDLAASREAALAAYRAMR